MLPEFLFPVVNSMQDISRDDFSLLDGAPAASVEKQPACSSTSTVYAKEGETTPTTTTTATTNHLSSAITTKTIIHAPYTNQTENNINTNNNNNNNNKSNGFLTIKSIETTTTDLHQQQQQAASNHHGSYFEGSMGTINAGINHHQSLLSAPFEQPQQQQPYHQQQNQYRSQPQQPQQHQQQSPYQEHHHHPSPEPLNHHHHHHHHQHHSQYRLMNVPGPNNKLLLLQSSDDPLICRGANTVSDDDPPAEFNTLMAAAANKERDQHRLPATQSPARSTLPSPRQSVHKQQSPTARASANGCSSATKQQLKIKASLMSQTQQQQQTQQPNQQQHHHQHSNQIRATPAPNTTKARASKERKKSGALKLRFHHQALPAEYLSHYEATQAQLKGKGEVTPAKLPPTKSANENVRSWLQKIAEIHRSSHQQTAPDSNNNQLEGDGDMLLPQRALHTNLSETARGKSSSTVAALTKRVIKYSDLPFMGEITLDHSKPRRGRKPKKADICHLIYKNYGTILPGTPRSKLNATLNVTAKEGKAEGGGGEGAAGLQHAKLSPQQNNRTAPESGRKAMEEPLNLCLRDHRSVVYDSFSISSFDEDEIEDYHQDELRVSLGNGGTPNSITPLTPNNTDLSTDSLLSTNLKSAMPPSLLLEQSSPKVSPQKLASPTTLSPQAAWSIDVSPTSPASMLNTPLLHPISLYYQKLIESGTLAASNGWSSDLGCSIETIERDNQLALKIPIPSGLFLTPKPEKPSAAATSSSGTPQQQPPVEYPEPLSTPSSVKSENSIVLHSNVSSPLTPSTPHSVAPKRKRSAIYIPPMPAENAHNPSNEVSICKFKFTGGARPTLQEKKMLSVDAGGNYRYYSGTGDKSARGYEYFPRESVQQNGGILPGVNSVAGAGAGEKMLLDIPPPSTGLSNELLQIPDSPTANMLLFAAPTTTSTEVSSGGAPLLTATDSRLSGSPQPILPETPRHQQQQPQQRQTPSERKKKTRRSTERENLEKTFKEKGFLIQTQQLESAEGATYCKFRQLKKFTRYLFRNWKDYLPDELQQANEAAAAVAAAAVLNQHHHQLQPPAVMTSSQSSNDANIDTNSPVSRNMVPNGVENILTSHGFVRAAPEETHILHERLVEESRMTVEPKLD